MRCLFEGGVNSRAVSFRRNTVYTHNNTLYTYIGFNPPVNSKRGVQAQPSGCGVAIGMWDHVCLRLSKFIYTVTANMS